MGTCSRGADHGTIDDGVQAVLSSSALRNRVPSVEGDVPRGCSCACRVGALVFPPSSVTPRAVAVIVDRSAARRFIRARLVQLGLLTSPFSHSPHLLE